jgi:mRNA-degrading endonuclease RelE of RelBE toxin-antitoxin system
VREQALENTEGAIKNGQPRETGNKGYTRQRKTQYVLDSTVRKQTQTM